MADLQKLVDELSKLTVLEAAELSKKLEEAWGVSAAAAVRLRPRFQPSRPRFRLRRRSPPRRP